MADTHESKDDSAKGKKTWYEEFTVSGNELLDQVKKLVAEGNVRRVFIKNPEGRTLLEIPLTVGVAITAVTAAFAPILVAVGAIAALLTSVTIGVEREDSDDGAGGNPDATDGKEPPVLEQ